MLKRSLLFIACLSFCLCLCTVALANRAADEIAPLVEETTVAVIHVDLSRLNLEQTVKSLSEIVETVMRETMPPEELNEMLPMVQMGIAFGGMMAAHYANTLTQQGKANDFYLLLDANDIMSKIITGIIVTPVGNLTAAETDAIRALFADINMPVSFVRHGFVIVVVPAEDVDTDDIREYARNRFRDVTPFARPEIAEAFDTLGEATFRTMSFLPDAFRDMVMEMMETQMEIVAMEMAEEENVPPVVEEMISDFKKMVMLMLRETQWAGNAFDLVHPRYYEVYQFTDAAVAQEMYDIIRRMVDSIPQIATEMEAIIAAVGVGLEAVGIIRASGTIANALLEKLMPEPTGNRLEYRIDETNFAEVFDIIKTGLRPVIDTATRIGI